jgi:hypothetical protein
MNKRLKSIHTFEQHTSELNISDVISRFIDTLSKKYDVVSNNLLIGKTGDKLYIYTQDEYGYLKLLETININDL